MYYHATIMVLFGLLKTSYRYPSRPMIIAPHEARETCVESALQVAQMIRLYRSKWGLEFISGTAVYWVSIALFVLLDELENPSNRRAFIDLCSTAKVLSKQWFLMKGILRMLQITARQKRISLPLETEHLLQDFETNMWRQDSGRRRLSSAFPNFSLLFQLVTGVRGGMHDPIDLDEYLEKLDEESKLDDLSRLEIVHDRPAAPS